MKRVLFFCSFLVLGFTLYAQQKALSSSSGIPPKHTPENKEDSSKSNSYDKSSSRRKKLIQSADTLTSGDFMMSIERVNENLNSIRDSVQLGFETVYLGRKINEIANDINLIRQNIGERRSVVNVKSIYLYRNFATTLNDDNTRIRARINKFYNRAFHAKLHLKTVLADSIFRVLLTDKNSTELYDKKLTRLDRKWARTDSTVKANIDTLNVMLVNASDNAMNLSNMLNILDRRLDRARPQIFGQEVDHLWHLHKTDSLPNANTKTLNIVSSENKAIGYYLSQTAGKRKLILFIGILLFVWLVFKRKLLKEIRGNEGKYGFMPLQYLKHHPVLSLLVSLLCLTPFFDAYAPTSYITIVYLLLLAAASMIFGRKYDRPFLFYWMAFVALFVADTLTYLLIEPTWIARMWMMAIHITIFTFTFIFYKQLARQTPLYNKWTKPAVLIGLILMVLAVICNLLGRFSLSGILGLSGIFAITQVLILPVFIDTVVEIILVQLLGSRLKKGVDSPFDCSVVTNKIKMPLLLVALLLWVVMLTSNLNIYNALSNSVVDALTTIRTIGSISFKLISVLMFFVIIWFAHILQRLISFFFGETGSETEDLTTVTKGQHSRLLITRLLVLIGGYLLAIAASGLPIDKLTFLLGALGVGIGMGLQNIVNNFVSGIILIFDGSLQIGDEIEVSGQAGKVKEIGLRASTLYTAEGAEVIIPNGTILSQNIVNWTFSNDQKRVTITFTLSGNELDANVVNDIINTTFKEIPLVISKRNPVILYTKVTPDTLSLTVRFWSTIGNVDQVKSAAMLQLSAAFSAKKIGFNQNVFNCLIAENNSSHTNP